MRVPRRFSPARLFSVAIPVLALLSAILTPSHAQASGMYQLTDLGIAPAGYGDPVINPSGRVIEDPEGGGSVMKAGSYSISNQPSHTPSNNTVTYLSQNGSVIATLNTLLGDPISEEIRGYAVNKSGMVVGSEQTGQFLSPLGIGFYYTLSGGMHAIPQVYPAINALNAALSVNDAGMVVGTATGPGGDSYSQPQRAFLSNGQMSWDLNTLIAQGSGLTLTSATFISDSGLIAGFGVDSKNQEHIVLLTPTATPEPSGLMIFAVGSLAFVARKTSRVFRDAGTGVKTV